MCAKEGGHLTNIETMTEHNFLSLLLYTVDDGTDIWMIGGRRKNQNGIGKSLYAFKRNQRIHRGKGTTGNHLYKQSNLTWLTARSFQVGSRQITADNPPK